MRQSPNLVITTSRKGIITAVKRMETSEWPPSSRSKNSDELGVVQIVGLGTSAPEVNIKEVTVIANNRGGASDDGVDDP